MHSLIDPANGALFFLVFSGLVLITLMILRCRKEAEQELRDVSGLKGLEKEAGRAAESGQPIHIALGNGELSGADTITSLAALQVLEGLVDASVAYDAPPIVTVGDATLLPLAQDALRRAYERREALELYDPGQVRFVAPSPLAYAAGVNPVGTPEGTVANVAAGAYGFEVSLIADGSARRRTRQWAAADNAQAIGALYPSTDRLAVGEDLYAIGAQVTEKGKYTTSLIAEDILRLVVALAILGAAALALATG
ncbi:MAG: DUF6754 domain-containing protein [Anaerolineae bacterium]